MTKTGPKFCTKSIISLPDILAVPGSAGFDEEAWNLSS
jgi:hypothetical protein